MVGIISALMAQKGFNGPPAIIEGEDGFLQAYSYNREYDTSWITERLGETWAFVKTSIKVYPCCRYSAGHLDACLEIARRYHPDPEKRVRIFIRSSEYTIKLLARPRKMDPQNVVDTQFSMPWQAAIALIDGKVNVDTFTEEDIHRQDVRQLMRKVEWVVDEEFEQRYPEHYSCAVTVTMEDGTEYTSEIENPKGDWRNPVTQEELEQKFISLATREIKDRERIERIIDFVTAIHEVDDVGKLFELTS
jgi:2-methylcitrate dehydratase PrpD